MLKVVSGVCLVLMLCCYFLYSSMYDVKEELILTKADLAQADKIIQVKDQELKATDKVLSQLKKDYDKVREERDVAAKTINSLLEKEENAAWGKSVIPKDVRDFLLNMNQKPKEGAK